MKVSKGSWHYRFQEWVFLNVVRGQRQVWHQGHWEPATWPPEMDAQFPGQITATNEAGKRMFFTSGFYSPLDKNTFFDPSKRNNLCPYLRGLVWCALAVPSVGIGTGLLHPHGHRVPVRQAQCRLLPLERRARRGPPAQEGGAEGPEGAGTRKAPLGILEGPA